MSLAHYHGVERRRESAPAAVRPTPVELIVHCLAERTGNHWQAFSLEFGLAVQGDSLADVKRRLEVMIASYVYDALIGEDRGHAKELLNRKATWNIYAKYYAAELYQRVERIWGASKDTILFSEPVPLAPVCAS